MGRSHKQAAAIPYRVHGQSLQIALVTTSGRKGWIMPKGSLDKGECGCDAAIRETQEEAGLVGELTAQPIGRYYYSKENEWYDVDVYVMRVTIVLASWPEASHRHRRWMTVDEAVERLDPELHAFVHETARIARSGRRPRCRPTTAQVIGSADQFLRGSGGGANIMSPVLKLGLEARSGGQAE